MVDEKKIDALLQRATDAGLDGLDFLASFSRQELAEGYNGIGPEFLPAGLRAQVTSFLWMFEAAALVHDMRNHVSDGTRENFDFANVEFRFNCFQLSDRAYPWWNWKRYRARLVADALYDFVSSPAGWKAWLEAHEKHINLQNKENNQ